MSSPTLAVAEQQLRLWEGIAASIARGRTRTVAGAAYGAAEKEEVARHVRHWQTQSRRLAARASIESERFWGGASGFDRGRIVAGLGRRVA